jgi:hypothetical protein
VELTGFISLEQSKNILKRFGLQEELAHSYNSSEGVAYEKLIASMK